jgi:CSLREA domain-containing protein
MKTRLGLVILLGFGGMLMVYQGPSFAKMEGMEFTVNSTADIVDDNPGDGACSTVFGVCTLRAAIMETNALVGANSISLPAGHYMLALPGSNENGCLTGDLDIVDDLTITGAGTGSSVVDANQLDRVVQMSTGNTFALSDLTILGGNLPTGQSGGGGIWADGNRYLSRVEVTNNIMNGEIISDADGGILATGLLKRLVTYLQTEAVLSHRVVYKDA